MLSFRDIALAIQSQFNSLDLSAVPIAGERDPASASPLILLSPPRTGSTLVYQYLIDSFRLAFISNIMSLLPRHMLAIQRLQRRIARCRHTNLHAGHYGFVPGLCAPSEAGKVLDRWFAEEQPGEYVRTVQQLTIALERQWGQPLIIKAPSLSLHAEQVSRIFPAARIILLTRDPAFIAQSILIGRTNRHIPDEQWLGVEPSGYRQQAARGLVYQTVWQVREILRALDDNIMPAVRVDYTDFCADPKKSIHEIAKSCNMEPNVRLHQLPDHFDAADSIRVDTATWSEIIRSCDELGLVSGSREST